MSGALRAPENIKNAKSRLEDHVSLFPTPTANDAKNNGAASQMNRNSAPLDVVAGGALNPDWVEALQGFPIGWTRLEG